MSFPDVLMDVKEGILFWLPLLCLCLAQSCARSRKRRHPSLGHTVTIEADIAVTLTNREASSSAMDDTTYPWGARHDGDVVFSESVLPRDDSLAEIAPWTAPSPPPPEVSAGGAGVAILRRVDIFYDLDKLWLDQRQEKLRLSVF